MPPVCNKSSLWEMFSLQAQTLTLTKILRSHRRHDTAVFTGSSWWLRRPLCLKLLERPLNISAFVAFNAQRFPQALNLCGVKVNSRTNKHTGETSDSRICSRSSNHTNVLVVHYHCCITFHRDGHFEPDGLLQHTGQSVFIPCQIPVSKQDWLTLSETTEHVQALWWCVCYCTPRQSRYMSSQPPVPCKVSAPVAVLTR